MVMSDSIAVSILLFCMVLGILGALKWLLRLFAGIALGLLILTCIGLLTDNPRFDQISRGAFKDGTVIPYLMDQVSTVGEFLSSTDNGPYEKVVINRMKQS